MIQNISDPIGFMRDYCDCTGQRGYILMGIARRAHNPEISNSEEITYRRLITDTDHIERQYNDLQALMAQHEGLTFRLYLSINARDLMTAYWNFRDQLNGWTRRLFNGDDGIEAKLSRLDSEWLSCAHRPDASDDSFFQWDLDDITEAEAYAFINHFEQSTPDHAEILTGIETPNGYHIITTPFNHTTFDPDIEPDDMDTDGQLFIEEIQT